MTYISRQSPYFGGIFGKRLSSSGYLANYLQTHFQLLAECIKNTFQGTNKGRIKLCAKVPFLINYSVL